MESTSTCQECGAVLDDVAPCPDCGATDREGRFRGEAAIVAVAAVSAAAKVTRQNSPHWTQMWAQIDRRIVRLRAMYQPRGVTNSGELEDELDAFLIACFHLSDWLKHIKLEQTQDAAEAAARAAWKKQLGKAVDRLFKRPDMALCKDYANTFKHYDRGCSTDRIARLRETETMPDGGEKLLVASWPADNAPAKQYVDGLELAERCYNEWQVFLKRRGLMP